MVVPNNTTKCTTIGTQDDGEGATSAMAAMLEKMSHLEGDDFSTEVEVAKDVTAVAYAGKSVSSPSLCGANIPIAKCAVYSRS